MLESPTQAFSCAYCENFKNSFFYGTLLVATSAFPDCSIKIEKLNVNILKL